MSSGYPKELDLPDLIANPPEGNSQREHLGEKPRRIVRGTTPNYAPHNIDPLAWPLECIAYLWPNSEIHALTPWNYRF
jgi:hypothetical protein